jgi:hypothetical protein
MAMGHDLSLAQDPAQDLQPAQHLDRMRGPHPHRTQSPSMHPTERPAPHPMQGVVAVQDAGREASVPAIARCLAAKLSSTLKKNMLLSHQRLFGCVSCAPPRLPPVARWQSRSSRPLPCAWYAQPCLQSDSL